MIALIGYTITGSNPKPKCKTDAHDPIAWDSISFEVHVVMNWMSKGESSQLFIYNMRFAALAADIDGGFEQRHIYSMRAIVDCYL